MHLDEYTVHVVAGVLKLFFRQLAVPIIAADFYMDFIRTAGQLNCLLLSYSLLQLSLGASCSTLQPWSVALFFYVIFTNWVVSLKEGLLFSCFRTYRRKVASASSLQFGTKIASSKSKHSRKTCLSSCKVRSSCSFALSELLYRNNKFNKNNTWLPSVKHWCLVFQRCLSSYKPSFICFSKK